MNRHLTRKLFPLIFLAASVVAAQSASPRKDIPSIAKAANGAVVSIVMSDKDGKPIAQGSGFLVSKDGIIITNYHVIAEGSSALVKLPDGAFFVVDGVLASDKTRDVAVIKAHGDNFRTLTLGNSDRVQVGQQVVAIGNPLSLESTVSNGIVSGIRADETLGGKFLQVTTPISPGSSGGPLFNMGGQVIGITTLYLKGGENLNFAIPINDAKPLLVVKSAKLQNFPNEAQLAEAQQPNLPAPATAAANMPKTARDFYQQLYDAGAFTPEAFVTLKDGSRVSVGHYLNTNYVCFSDDGQSQDFFTFQAWAYDEQYAQASDQITPSTPSKEELKLWDTIQEIQQTAPYVQFIYNEMLNAYPSDTQKFFRGGGRALSEDVYSKGVKVNTLEYHWDGSSWFLPFVPVDPNAYTRRSKIFRISIEASTMRYADSESDTITVGHGDTAATQTEEYGPWGGTCEKIPDPK